MISSQQVAKQLRCNDKDCIMTHLHDDGLNGIGYNECDIIKLEKFNHKEYKQVTNILLDNRMLTHHGHFKKANNLTEYAFNIAYNIEIAAELKLIDKVMVVGEIQGSKGKYLYIMMRD